MNITISSNPKTELRQCYKVVSIHFGGVICSSAYNVLPTNYRKEYQAGRLEVPLEPNTYLFVLATLEDALKFVSNESLSGTKLEIWECEAEVVDSPVYFGAPSFANQLWQRYFATDLIVDRIYSLNPRLLTLRVPTDQEWSYIPLRNISGTLFAKSLTLTKLAPKQHELRSDVPEMKPL
jgi:hypothetical protein